MFDTETQPTPPPASPKITGHRYLFRMWEPSRAALESLSYVPSLPLLLLEAHRAPDHHPVLMFPGLGAGNWSTVTMRGHLMGLGYNVHGIRKGTQQGTPARVIAAFRERIEELADTYSSRVSVVAWSVGGAYARQAALGASGSLRQVITLGSPLNGPWYQRHTWIASQHIPVPSTCVYSSTDGIYDWHRCCQPEGPMAENVNVFSSHFGMANNPLAIRVVTDRLAQPEGKWHPYAADDAHVPETMPASA